MERVRGALLGHLASTCSGTGHLGRACPGLPRAEWSSETVTIPCHSPSSFAMTQVPEPSMGSGVKKLDAIS